MSLLAGKTGIVFGVANKRSIAWAIAQAWAREGAKLAFTYQGERVKENVEELAGTFGIVGIELRVFQFSPRQIHICRILALITSDFLGKCFPA